MSSWACQSFTQTSSQAGRQASFHYVLGCECWLLATAAAWVRISHCGRSRVVGLRARDDAENLLCKQRGAGVYGVYSLQAEQTFTVDMHWRPFRLGTTQPSPWNLTRVHEMTRSKNVTRRKQTGSSHVVSPVSISSLPQFPRLQRNGRQQGWTHAPSDWSAVTGLAGRESVMTSQFAAAHCHYWNTLHTQNGAAGAKLLST